MQVEQVQRWVMSALVMVTGLIFAGGLCFLAGAADDEFVQPGAKPALLVIAGVVGVLTMAGARAIHQSRIASPWLVVGVVPALVGWWWLYLR